VESRLSSQPEAAPGPARGHWHVSGLLVQVLDTPMQAVTGSPALVADSEAHGRLASHHDCEAPPLPASAGDVASDGVPTHNLNFKPDENVALSTN
jgi:hypothetical protein